jgi:hypothetical protein
LTAVVVVVVAVVGLAVADALTPASPTVAATGALDAVSVAPPGSYASSAFCAGGAAGADGLATTTIYLVNSTPAAVQGVMSTRVAPGTATASSSRGSASPPVHRSIVIPAGGSAAVNPASGVQAGDLATSFAFDGGGVGVNQVVTGPGGWSTAPCATQTSENWYFAGGSTAGGGRLSLDLFNPTATDAVLDLSFLTPGGVVVPSTYQGLVVPAGQTVTENVGDFVQGQSEIGTVVAAQSGSVVADELQRWTSGPVAGVSLRLGAPAVSSSWQFAQTTEVAGGTVIFHLANPGASASVATLDFGLPGASVRPVQLSIPAHSVATFVATGAKRLPVGIPYSVDIKATAAIVASRSVQAPGSAASPTWGASSGATTVSTRWMVPAPGVEHAPGTAAATVDSLGVANPGASPVRVVVTVEGTGAAVASLAVAPGSVAVLGSKLVGGLRPLSVRSTGPVAVEEDSGPAGAPGIVSSTGLPFWP